MIRKGFPQPVMDNLSAGVEELGKGAGPGGRNMERHTPERQQLKGGYNVPNAWENVSAKLFCLVVCWRRAKMKPHK